MSDQPDPLALFRALADQYVAQAAETARKATGSTTDEARRAQQGIAAGWQHAEFLLRRTLNDPDNSRTTGNNPRASDSTRRRALARNAVAPVLKRARRVATAIHPRGSR
ncbi:hypothetical protein [Streptomyces xanthochromogenes]|uniref:Uncharacterized protein n=1 Tax=Streptomyces xanthochromogenes TaxID=67384 RepID=A0ABQ3AXX0_9ACTN|nr:hypothetical protein [Streptomyces xanthochromogenes]GGY71239.1 hypothetical protein GCM10010326_76760 [Streptomyces xanthochromogenes]